MVYDVIRYPDPRLETPCDPVDVFDTPELRKLVEDMFETMYYHKGVGLAAPQIGVMKRIAVVDVSLGEEDDQKVVIINPRVARKSGSQRDEEGCLCFPGFREKVTRAMNVTVEARDAAGREIRLEGEGLYSRALQHEIDHLNGILFIQHVSALKRDLIRRKIRKMVKAGEWDPVVPGPRTEESPALWA